MTRTIIITWGAVVLLLVVAMVRWLSGEPPIRDIGPCYQGMTLPPRTSCTMEFQIGPDGAPRPADIAPRRKA
jgi:hypothetical protein